MSQAQLPLEGVYHLQTINYLNGVFGSNFASEQYWKDILPKLIEMQFEGALDIEKQKDEMSVLKKEVNLQSLFHRLLQLTEFKWSTPLLQEVSKN